MERLLCAIGTEWNAAEGIRPPFQTLRTQGRIAGIATVSVQLSFRRLRLLRRSHAKKIPRNESRKTGFESRRVSMTGLLRGTRGTPDGTAVYRPLTAWNLRAGGASDCGFDPLPANSGRRTFASRQRMRPGARRPRGRGNRAAPWRTDFVSEWAPGLLQAVAALRAVCDVDSGGSSHSRCWSRVCHFLWGRSRDWRVDLIARGASDWRTRSGSPPSTRTGLSCSSRPATKTRSLLCFRSAPSRCGLFERRFRQRPGNAPALSGSQHGRPTSGLPKTPAAS